MDSVKQGKKRPVKRSIVKHKTSLKALAIALVLVVIAAFAYMKVQPYTGEAKTRLQLQQSVQELERKKEQLQEIKEQSAEDKKQLEETNKKLEEKEKELQAKREAQKVYAASRPSQAAISGNAAKAFIYNHESGNCPTKWQGEHGDCPAYHGTPSSASVGYGICQATPGWKMASAGADWATNYATQDKWCSQYAADRYGGWQGAYNFWVANKWW